MSADTIELNPIELATELTIAWLSNPNTRTSADEVPAFLGRMHNSIAALAGNAQASGTTTDVSTDYSPAVTARKSLADPDYIVSMMVSRSNVEGGESTVTDNHRQVLWQRTLQKPLDIMIGQDALTMHAVTPVAPLDPAQPAWRDVLVIAFTKVQP